MACSSLDEILALIRGTIDPAEKAAVQAHISSGCTTCSENHRWLTEMLVVTARDDSFDFSVETIAWSVAQFRAASASAPSRMQILARLVFDSLLPAQTVEVRSMAAPGVSRQMLYQGGGYDVDLRLEQFEAESAIFILGQIVSTQRKPDELAGLSVEMTHHGSSFGQQDNRTAETDGRGMFRLRDIVPGEYDIVIRLPEGDFSINAITCRPR
jgi:hypothetical protein